MRTLLISLAAAASALAVASPASAQWAPPVPHGAPGHGYGHGYGYGYGHGGYEFHQVRMLQDRIQRLRERIVRMDRMDRLSHREARRLDRHAAELQHRVHFAARRGLNPWERRDIEHRVEALSQAVRYAARENRRWGWNGFNAHDNSFGYYGARMRDDDRRFDRDDDDDDNDRRGRGRGRGRDD